MLRQWPIIAACVIAAGIAGFAYSSTRPAQYAAVTTMQLNEVDLGSLFLDQNLQQDGQDAQSKTATNAKLIMMPRVREAASRALDGRISADDLRDRIAVDVDAETTLVSITATDGSPQFAASMADAMLASFIEVRRQTLAVQFRDAAQEVQRQLTALPKKARSGQVGTVLRKRLDQIATLRAVTNGGVTTVQTARIPKTRTSPNPIRDTILALLAGAIAGLGIALIRSRLDDRLRGVDEFTEVWDLPVLGLISESNDLTSTDGPRIPPAGALEAFVMARTNLRYLHVGGNVRRVVVTSAVEGEGKSTVAWNLAVAAALAGARVLTIDADLRRPVLAQRVRLSGGPGLSEVLAGIAEPAQAIRTVRLEVPNSAPCEISVVPSGMVPPAPVALLERPESSAQFAALCEGYDLVLIDSPPATVVADAKVLQQFADGIVVVSRLGRARRGNVERLRDTLAGLPTPVLGAIINGAGEAVSYGYAASEQPATDASPATATSLSPASS